MERVIGTERLYSSIKQLIERKEDIDEVRKRLGIIHLNLLKRDLFHRTDEKEFTKELEVYHKIAFYLLTRLTNFQCEKELCLQGFEVAAFCFEVLCKSARYPEHETMEYGILSAICYSLAENQANSIILARLVIGMCQDREDDSDYIYLYAMFLAREYKKIARMRESGDKLRNAVIAFSESMLYRKEQRNHLNALRRVLVQLRREGSEHYYFFRLIFLVSEKMDTYSVRNLLGENRDMEEYVDVLTQKEEQNVYELWQSQSFLLSRLNRIKEERDIFFLSMPTSAGKTLVSELLLYKFLAEKEGMAIYVVPTIALTNEIEKSFIKRFRKVGIHVWKEIEFDEESNIEEPAISILTPEKLDLLIRKQTDLLKKIKCIVFDEFHKISDGQRGWLEETLIAWFIYNREEYDYKIIMMSAIVDGLEDSLSDIDASIYGGKWTPSKKLYGMFYLPEGDMRVRRNRIKKQEEIYENYAVKIKYDSDLKADVKNVFQGATYGKKTKDGKDEQRSDKKYDLCWKAINTLKEEPILVYFHTKKDMKSFIGRSGKYRPESRDGRLLALKQTIIRQLGANHPLIGALDYGVAFHNGDLPEDVRVVIESAYRDKVIKILACTTTLAEGVNLPVSTLVLGTVFTFDRDGSLNLGDYKNIVGRIGRALVDTEGKIFLIRYPDIYKEKDMARFQTYYYGEKITNRLESAFERYQESDFEAIEEMEIGEMTRRQRDLKAMMERIQIFVFSLYELIPEYDLEGFQIEYRNAFFLMQTPKIEKIMDKYVGRYYDMARNVPFHFLQNCNRTGVSYHTNMELATLAEEISCFEEIDDSLFRDIYLSLLECDEFLPEDDEVNHNDAISLWLEGCSYMELRDTVFKDERNPQTATVRCTKYIKRMFQYIVPWAISALIVYMDENTYIYEQISALIKCVKYGTRDENVIALRESGIRSRELAIDLSAIYTKEKGKENETKITEWLVNVHKEKLQNFFGRKFDKYILEQIAAYRSVKREISHYFEQQDSIRCRIAGLRYYDYPKIGADYFEENNQVVLVQDKENEYDMYAVKVMTADENYMLGYIPMKCSEEIYDIIESGYGLDCAIREIDREIIRIQIKRN